MLFPFFNTQDASHYCESALYKYISFGKDIFYRFINNGMIDCRKFAYSQNLQLIRKVEKQSTAAIESVPRCIIVDYTDLSKTGRHFEFIGIFFTPYAQFQTSAQ